MATKKTTKKTSSPRRRASTTATRTRATTKKSTGGKKVTRTKTPTRRARQKPQLTIAAPEHAFWVCDGTVLHSLTELAEALATMDKETFAHHVGKEKNDFATWSEEVLGDIKAAAALRKAKTPAGAKRAVNARLKTYA